MTKRLDDGRSSNGKIGGFMGFDDTSDSDSESEVDIERGPTKTIEVCPSYSFTYGKHKTNITSLFQEHDKYSNVIFQGNLLDGLPNWLDRLFEGTTHRYSINYWPDFPTK